MNVCQAVDGLPQPGAPAQDNGKSNTSLSLPEDYIWGSFPIQDKTSRAGTGNQWRFTTPYQMT